MLAARAAALTTNDATAKATLVDFEQRTASALQELRSLVQALRPKSLERDGLAATITDHADALRTSGLRVIVNAATGMHLPLETEHALLRIAQEALHNAMRHAPGAAVRVTLRAGARAVTLSIRDDGPGFDAAALPRTRRGMGLATMRERAHEIGAELVIHSRPGAGTTVTVTVSLS